MKRGAALGLAIAACALAWDPNANAAEPKRVFALIVAIVVTASSIFSSRDRSGGAPRPWLFALGFVGVSALSALWGAPSGLLDLATWAAALFVGVSAAREGRGAALRSARVAALVTGGALSIWALASWACGHRGFSIHAGQGNPNWLGLVVAITLPISVDVALRARRWKRSASKYVAIALVIMQPAALFASHSRVAAVASLASLAWLGLRLRRRRTSVRHGAKLAAAALLAVGLVAALEHRRPKAAHPPPPIAAIDPSPEDVPATRSLRGRLWIASRSLEAAARAAPFGAGLGRFGHVYLAVQGERLEAMETRAASRSFVNATTAHDELLQAAVESGPLAAVLLACLLASVFTAHRRARWHAGAAAAIALAICALGDSPLRQPAICLLFALQGAALPSAARPARHRRARAFVSLVAASWMLLVATRGWLATRTLEAAREASPEARLGMLKKAVKIDRGSGDAWLALGLEEIALGSYDAALEDLTQASTRIASVAANVAMGEAHLARGDAAAAYAALEAARALQPGSLRVRLALAEASRRLGKLDEAERHVRAARAVAPGDPRVATLAFRIGEDVMDAAR